MKIENSKLDAAEAFKNYIYTVPDYQREYVWGEKEVNKLLEDINEEYSREKGADSEYFIGSIVVRKNGKEVEVIDGQQRLTTLVLCLCAFKKLLSSSKKYANMIQEWLFSTKIDDRGKISESYNLLLQYEDTQDLLKRILQEEAIESELRDSSKRIYEAYVYALDYLKTNFVEKSDEGLIEYLGYFTNKVKFIQIETPSISDALKIFETINERGVGLNPMDLLKNLMFRQLKREEFDKLKTQWTKIINLLEKHHEKSLRFLRYFIMGNYSVKIEKMSGGKKVTREIITEDEIYDWITDNKNQCGYHVNPFAFVQKLHSNAEAYVNFANGRYVDGERNIWLHNIEKLGGSLSQHLVLLLAAKDFDKELFNHLAKQIEALLFYYIVTKTQTKELEVKFSQWAGELRAICSLEKGKHKDALNEFILTKFVKEMTDKETEFKLRILSLNLASLQGYRIKYILGKITQFVESQRLGEKKQSEFLDRYLLSKIHIEHILPDHPTTDLRNDFEKSNGERSYDENKIMLGNLTLFEEPLNTSAGRDYFEKKKPKYKASTFYLTRSIVSMDKIGDTSIDRINKDLQSFEIWNKKSINDRQEMLYRLSKKIWAIERLD